MICKVSILLVVLAVVSMTTSSPTLRRRRDTSAISERAPRTAKVAAIDRAVDAVSIGGDDDDVIVKEEGEIMETANALVFVHRRHKPTKKRVNRTSSTINRRKTSTATGCCNCKKC